jgi:hypothetical protein
VGGSGRGFRSAELATTESGPEACGKTRTDRCARLACPPLFHPTQPSQGEGAEDPGCVTLRNRSLHTLFRRAPRAVTQGARARARQVVTVASSCYALGTTCSWRGCGPVLGGAVSLSGAAFARTLPHANRLGLHKCALRAFRSALGSPGSCVSRGGPGYARAGYQEGIR